MFCLGPYFVDFSSAANTPSIDSVPLLLTRPVSATSNRALKIIGFSASIESDPSLKMRAW